LIEIEIRLRGDKEFLNLITLSLKPDYKDILFERTDDTLLVKFSADEITKARAMFNTITRLVQSITDIYTLAKEENLFR
jgi:tRNA threonylcarbamoyladenosine modification (KEOPS) complex  Pcc1 subunit